MRITIRFALLGCMFIAVAGCATIKKLEFWHKPVAPPTQSNPVPQAITRADAAALAADAATGKVTDKQVGLVGKARANIATAQDANGKQPAAPATDTVKNELGLADLNLSFAPVDPTERALGAEREAMFQSGKAAAAQEAYKTALASSAVSLTDLTTAKQEAKDAIDARDLARQGEKDAIAKREADITANTKEYNAKMVKLQQDDNAALQKERDDTAKKTQFWLTMGCYSLGVVCLLAAALRGYLAVQTMGVGVLSAAKTVAVFVLLGACFMGLGHLVAQTWFWTACGIVLGLTVVAAIVIAILDAHKTGALAANHKAVTTATDDVISGISEMHSALATPTADALHAVQSAIGGTVEQAAAAIAAVHTSLVTPALQSWVTAGDGVAEYVAQRSAALKITPPPQAPTIHS